MLESQNTIQNSLTALSLRFCGGGGVLGLGQVYHCAQGRRHLQEIHEEFVTSEVVLHDVLALFNSRINVSVPTYTWLDAGVRGALDLTSRTIHFICLTAFRSPVSSFKM